MENVKTSKIVTARLYALINVLTQMDGGYAFPPLYVK